MHIVLARPEGHGPGTKGLSMFLVPKYLVDEDGTLGERNGVYATNVEHKMGLKASTTCELTFGAEHPGGRHADRRACTTASGRCSCIIEFARMMVGTKAIATLSTGYLNALDYARSRVQGADLAEMTGQGRAAGHDHPPPGRPPHAAAAEGLRRGHARAGAVHRHDPGRRSSCRGARRGRTTRPPRLNDLLLPIVKGVGSESSYEQLAQSLQTLGGSGYLQEYPIEQYIRDAKIDSLYEGTTAIQGHGPVLPQDRPGPGAGAAAPAEQIREFAAADGGNGRLKAERAALADAAAKWRPSSAAMTGFLLASSRTPGRDVPGRPEHHPAAAGARRPGDRLAAAAPGRSGPGQARPERRGRRGRDFYQGKIAAARFFAATVLPRLAAEREIAEATSLDLMELPEAPSDPASLSGVQQDIATCLVMVSSRPASAAGRSASRRRRAARPSPARRRPAVVERQRKVRPPHRQLSVDHPGGVLDLAEGQDRGLAGGQDRGAGVDPEDADVGDRDRAARQVGRGGLARPRGLGQRPQARASSGSVSRRRP